jgi:hypothetical protein
MRPGGAGAEPAGLRLDHPFCRAAASAQGQRRRGDHPDPCRPGHRRAQRTDAAALPLALPRYPIELGWRTSTQIDPVVIKVREAIVACFNA